MSLTLYGFHDRPNDLAVTKVGAALDDCKFLLDFTRPLERIHWFGVRNRWLGPTIGLLIPVAHQGEEKGEFIISLKRGEHYFTDILKIWQKHRGSRRSLESHSVDPLRIIADFAKHFPHDCQ
jgi:hypothetical protein